MYCDVRDVWLQPQIGFPGKGGVDEGDTSTDVNKDGGVAAVDRGFIGGTGWERETVSGTDSLTLVVAKPAGFLPGF